MIFVVLGTQKFQCNRLLKELDNLIEHCKIKEPVFAQTGYSDYKPLNYKYTDFMDKNEFEDNIKNCNLLITHSGVGTIITGMKFEKPIIVFPRLKEFKEHIDNHQLEIAETFSKQSFVLLCGKKDSLEEQIAKSDLYTFKHYISQREKNVSVIKEFLYGGKK
ncbi:PssE/Cps14G family polysaccharide biosynthesis glycosyltransferase [Carnobacterium mobile]|uniref:PssE/Cps14G family polysaccharide biosynthesis glycosyltransferase n=1 Tax=Carnobacterium mobile TaxID=2750 RepID=UPI001867161F|nr:PssE/Cps14G family polysaccharide biosynthesis glycosyltransferase [Carnobacterium mobile]